MKTRFTALFTLATAGILLGTPTSRAATAYALTNTNSILTFDHLSPGTILNDVNVTGLGGYDLLGIDIRPTVQAVPVNAGVGSLWAVGRSGSNFQLFVINPATGAATSIASPITSGISTAPANIDWGFDFNPTVDRIRFVNDEATANNFRLNPNTGTLVLQDGNFNFATGDVNFGLTPTISAGAYTTGTFGGTTSLFYLDSNLNALVRSTNANAGTLVTIGTVNTDITTPGGFDIVGNVAVFSTNDVSGSKLFSIDLTNGQATSLGSFSPLVDVRDVAVAVVPEPGTYAMVVVVLGAAIYFRRRGTASAKVLAKA